MTESMMTLTLYIAFTISLGIFIGWFLSKIYHKPEVQVRVRRLNKSDAEKRIMELEALYLQEQDFVNEYQYKNRKLKGELLKKINLLSSATENLRNIQTSRPYVRIKELEQELNEFEDVLGKYEQRFDSLDNVQQ